MTELFTREGLQIEPGKIMGGDKPFTMMKRSCSRCGGAGRSDRWVRTGLTCFDCGGSGLHKNGDRKVTLYTAEKLAKLNAAGDKRKAKKRAKDDAAAAARALEAEGRKSDFLQVHGALIERAKGFAGRSQFIDDVIAKGLERSMLSEKQAAALVGAMDKMDAETARKAGATYLGKVGERLKDLEVKVARVHTIDHGEYSGNWSRYFHIVTMRDKAGNTLVVKGSSFCPEEGRELTLAGTVKSHEDYNGEKQTILARVKTVKENA